MSISRAHAVKTVQFDRGRQIIQHRLKIRNSISKSLIINGHPMTCIKIKISTKYLFKEKTREEIFKNYAQYIRMDSMYIQSAVVLYHI